MSDPNHWQNVYASKNASEVSWYREHLEASLATIDSLSLPLDAAIVDVGGGASTFVDDLLARGHSKLAVLDIASSALEQSKKRLGQQSEEVAWLVGDATSFDFAPQSIDFWHDRAVFHFLVEEEARAAYLAQVARAVKPGAHMLIATFAEHGPERCSGLPVARYSAETLAAIFETDFEKVRSFQEEHETPWQSKQAFVYVLLRKRLA